MARALRRLLYAPRRTTGPFAEQWCVLGTFPFQPNSALIRRPTYRAFTLGARLVCRAGGKQVARAGHSDRQLSRAAAASSVRGCRGQIGSILRDLTRGLRGDRGLAGRW